MAEIADRVRFPLIVAEGLDITFYGSVEALERDLEAIDVRNDIYVAYDSGGHRLRLGVTPPTKTRRILGITLDTTGIQFVRVEAAPLQPTHEAELRRLLIAFLGALGESVDNEEVDLSELVRRASDRAGIST